MVHDQHGDISRLAYFQGQQVQSEYSTRGAVRKMSYTARCLRWTQSCSKSFVKEVVGLLEMSDVILVRGTKRWTLDIIYCPPFWLWTSWVAVNLLRQYIVAIKDANLWFMRMLFLHFFFLGLPGYHCYHFHIWDFLDDGCLPIFGSAASPLGPRFMPLWCAWLGHRRVQWRWLKMAHLTG